MARPMIVIALACILAPSIGHAQESDTLLDDPRMFREGNETSKMLFLLPQEERHKTMTRFISANGQPCAAVTRTMYQGSAPDGVDFWSIDCGNASYMDVVQARLQRPVHGLQVFGVGCSSLEVLD